ncbi:hypothetical protein NA57DRAFT_52160 [Rhizodiscina lignyota]|uniref:Transcription factor domain-containing protein n=1 Tax=Rhizodiscina lignyota TaxID=1504668 RepID=A0A9P4M9B1_9PEZI|nr:hypothetical protein NA57DRAFT_52160 [Rhizodiscina lignyota]
MTGRGKQPRRPSARNGTRERRSNAVIGSLIFVNPVVGGGTPDDLQKQRTLVRAAAQRHARRERFWTTSATKGVSPQTPATPASSESDECVKRARLSKSKAPESRIVPPITISSGCFECLRDLGCPQRFDPFNTSAFNYDERTTELANYWVTNISTLSNATVAPIRTNFFKYAQTSEPLMHAVLAVTAAIVWAKAGGPDIDICYQITEAVKGVNRSLISMNDTSCLDHGAFYTVIFLWIVEKIFQCAPWERLQRGKDIANRAYMHRDALRRMVVLRGGLTALMPDRILFSFILWIETHSSLEDFWLSPNVDLASVLNITRPNSFTVRYDTVVESTNVFSHVIHSPSIQSLAHSVIHFTAIYHMWLRSSLGMPLNHLPRCFDVIDILNECCLLSLRFLSLLNSDGTYHISDNKEQTMALGFSGFLVLLMRPLDWARILSQHSCFSRDIWYGTAKATIASRLRVALLSLDDLIFLGTICDVLLWLFFVGGICAEDTDDRDFYAEYIHKIVAARMNGPSTIKSGSVTVEAIASLPGPRNWQEVEYAHERLKGVLWVEELFEPAVQRLWEEAAAKEKIAEV